MCSLGIEPTTFALLTQCSTTEPTQYISYFSLILIKITFLRTSHVSNTWFVKHFSLLQSLRSLLVFDSSINLWIIILMIIVFLIDTIKISIRIFVFNNLFKLNDLGSHYISNSMHFFFFKVSITHLSLYPIRWECGYFYQLKCTCLRVCMWNPQGILSTKEFKKLREAQRKLCSDGENAHSAHRWTLSDHPIRCKTTDRFPPTTNPKPLSALQPSSAHSADSPSVHHPALFQDLPRVCARFMYYRLG